MIAIDLDDSTPLYLQIIAAIRTAIADGSIPVGQRLPSARQLAGDLAVNLNTVARAYRVLERDGLLRIRHGRGVDVISDRVRQDAKAARAALRSQLQQATTDAMLAGLTPKAVETVFTGVMRSWPSD